MLSMPNRAVMLEGESQYQSSPHFKPKSKKWLWIGAVLITSPLIIFSTIGMIILFGALLIATEEHTNSISEYGAGIIPPEFIPIYKEAGKTYGVDWILLAAIHEIETDFSQNVSVSSAGAIGHTQFLKCTWVGWGYPSCSKVEKSVYTDLAIIEKYKGYGVDANGDGEADPYQIEDAIHATAKYLAANMKGETEEEKMRNAVFSYNRADWYVDEVMHNYKLWSTNPNAYSGAIDIEIIGDNAWPVPHTKRITDFFGTRGGNHRGLDISGPGDDTGQPIVAFADGTVSYSQFNGKTAKSGYGYLVILDHGNGIQSYYAHMMEQGIPLGTKVKAGQVVGKIGNTGNSEGAHLHFEIRINGKPVDPMPYVKKFIN